MAQKQRKDPLESRLAIFMSNENSSSIFEEINAELEANETAKREQAIVRAFWEKIFEKSISFLTNKRNSYAGLKEILEKKMDEGNAGFTLRSQYFKSTLLDMVSEKLSDENLAQDNAEILKTCYAKLSGQPVEEGTEKSETPQKTITRLKREITALKKQLASEKDKTKSADFGGEERALMQTEIENLKTQLGETEGQIDNTLEEVGTLNKEIERLNLELAKCREIQPGKE